MLVYVYTHSVLHIQCSRMPREERLKCIACDTSIGSIRKQLAGNGLWKLFLSARSLKRVNNDDGGCVDCRMKYLNWLKKIDGDFNQFDLRPEVQVNEIVNVSVLLIVSFFL